MLGKLINNSVSKLKSVLGKKISPKNIYKEYEAEIIGLKQEREWYREHFNLVKAEFYLIDSFEIYHFLPLYRYLEKKGIYTCFVAEKVEEGAWFDYKKAIEILKVNGLRYKECPDYDADFVFTTQDEYLIDAYKNKKVNLSYGIALTTYAYMESERTIDKFDLKLVHGDISKQEVRAKNKSIDIIKVGYPKHSVWGNGKFVYDLDSKKKIIADVNVDNKPILLYFPTWDYYSSINAYANAFKEIKKDFLIVTKIHHCTSRLDTEEEHRKIVKDISDVVLEGNFSIQEVVCMGDIAICDAVSGTSTEVPFLKNDMKLILLYSPSEEKNKYKEIIREYACCVKTSEELEDSIRATYKEDKYIEKRKQILKQLYYEYPEKGMYELAEYMLDTKKNERINF